MNSPTPSASTQTRTAGRDRRQPLRSRVRHGSPTCADYGCQRSQCRAAARRDRARRTSELIAGRPARIPSSEAAAAARRLQSTGLSASDIAEISGVAVTLVRRLLRPAEARPARIHRTTAEAILGIPLHTARRRERPLPGLVEADRAATSLQDLAEHGWPTSFLADQLRTSTHTLAAIRNRQRQRLTLALNRKIQRLATLLLTSDPADHGIATHRSRRAQAAARHRAPSVTPAITVPDPRQMRAACKPATENAFGS
ncbi:hypothetical protein [Streptomyces sp. DSM 40907]|uniref:hypothetical protein n=1 Tax=Streptomyces kutzneri TaxID=3051179 RepID=UPI0028D3F2D5|nr:hypothetical protein [Streptomyces sp. DSM 40907]